MIELRDLEPRVRAALGRPSETVDSYDVKPTYSRLGAQTLRTNNSEVEGFFIGASPASKGRKSRVPVESQRFVGELRTHSGRLEPTPRGPTLAWCMVPSWPPMYARTSPELFGRSR